MIDFSFFRRFLRRPQNEASDDLDDYCRTRSEFTERLLSSCNSLFRLGTLERGRRILEIIANSSPTQALTAAYFENLENLLKTKHKRAVPGKIVLGLGAGRCGSTSLVALLATVDGSCCTHENPPLIYWVPDEKQLDFHSRRFKFLVDYFSLVFDASHWWLNASEFFFSHFPNGKIVGLYRDVETCAQSFLRIKGPGRGSLNNWVPVPNNIWRSSPWDPTYPTYPIPTDAEQEPDIAKLKLIRLYIEDYNMKLIALEKRATNRVLLIRTEDLSQKDQQQRIFDFIGCSGRVSNIVLNVRTLVDGESDKYKF